MHQGHQVIRYRWWMVDNEGDPSCQKYAHFRARFLTVHFPSSVLFLFRGKVERIQGEEQREGCLYLDGYE